MGRRKKAVHIDVQDIPTDVYREAMLQALKRLKFKRRSEAARKGWETRRRKRQ